MEIIGNLTYKGGDWRQGREYQFMKLPKVLFVDQNYKKLSDGAKLLYAILLERMGLSVENDWEDEFEQVYIYYTNQSLRELLGWSHDKVTARLRELENAKLIWRKKNGMGKPDTIYVLPFSDTCDLKKDHSLRQTGTPACEEVARNKTEKNKTERFLDAFWDPSSLDIEFDE